MSALWKALFLRLRVKFLYSIVYHSQFDDSFKRINQIIEIALRFMIFIIESENWSALTDSLQRDFNNVITATEISSNQICYDFTSLTSIDLISDFRIFSSISRTQIRDNIAYEQMLVKKYYDNKHKSIHLKNETWVLLRLHKKYNIFNIFVLDFKLSQQYTKSFQVLKKIDNLVYKLNISFNWRVHSIFFIVQLKSIDFLAANSFQKISLSTDSVFVKKDTENAQFFEIEKIITKRINKRKNTKYLIKWLKYDSEHDQWRNTLEMRNAMNLMNEFERKTAINSK